MIKGLGLSNFKSYQEMNHISFKKMNVFLGPNSSGKSSFIKALSLLRESIISNDSKQPLVLNERVGDYKSLVNGGKTNNKIKFEIDVEQSAYFLKKHRSYVLKSLLFLLFEAEESGLRNVSEMNDFIRNSFEKYEKDPIEKLTIELKTTNKNPVMISSIKFNHKSKDSYRIYTERAAYYLEYEGKKIEIPNLFTPHKFLFKVNVEKFVQAHEDLKKIILGIHIAIENIFQELQDFYSDYYHVGAFRTVPNRIEMINNKTFKSVGYNGENLIPALLSLFKEDDIEKERNKEKHKENIKFWLKEFGIANGFEIRNQESINRYSLSIKNKHTDIKSNIVDVGTGTSQLLPFIVESIISPVRSTLIIEEPESHIHPNAQSTLADLFVEKIMQDKKTFFIETHSMYLLQKLQIHVAKGNLTPQEIGVFYFNQGPNGTNVKELKLNNKGQFIQEFPQGFYDVAYKLSSQLMEEMWVNKNEI